LEICRVIGLGDDLKPIDVDPVRPTDQLKAPNPIGLENDVPQRLVVRHVTAVRLKHGAAVWSSELLVLIEATSNGAAF
jgi:hypothetical protein